MLRLIAIDFVIDSLPPFFNVFVLSVQIDRYFTSIFIFLNYCKNVLSDLCGKDAKTGNVRGLAQEDLHPPS